MYVSRLSFSTLPGKGPQAAQELKKLVEFIGKDTGARPRVLRTHFASTGEADFQLEQEVESLSELERQVHDVSGDGAFQQWSQGFSQLLRCSPQRQVFEVLS
ncbi:MAG TPA: hypothetical protein VK009_13300 [Chloroflexota bacterium]|nr:hypothetical protein [Chloroflexota bacterium]